MIVSTPFFKFLPDTVYTSLVIPFHVSQSLLSFQTCQKAMMKETSEADIENNRAN